MGSSFVIGNKQVSADELKEKSALGTLKSLQTGTDPKARVAFSTGEVTRSAVLESTPETPGFTPIGIGKPMSIEILTVYTGDAPTKGLFSKTSDLLVVSGVKAVETFAAQPKAINQLVPKIGDNQYLQPSAFDQGSPIVYYTPSVVNDTTLCSFQMVTDRFDQDIFDQVASLFSQAAGLPIFAPQSSYLLAGSYLIKIAAKLGNALVDRGPFLSADLTLRFDTPDIPVSMAQNAVLYDDRNQAELSGYEVRFDGGSLKLVDPSSGKAYSGDAPYIIVSLDGRERDSLQSFTPTIAQASMLEKFYGSGDPGGAVLQALGSALELYNDFESRQKAEGYAKTLDELKQKISALDPSAADYSTQKATLLASFTKTQTSYDAWRGRIEDELFQLPEITAPT